MTVKQLTITMPNKPGQLASISETLGDAGVNVLAFFVSTSTSSGDGIMRFVVDNPEKGINVLRGQGLDVKEEDVVAAETPHHAGGLLAVLNPLKRAQVNVDYIYPCIQTGEATILIIGAGGQTKEAIECLKKDWIRLYGSELYNM
ncbi:MAG: ACT domain-containing protein [Proteobacteria bacterium]|nr:ACT domain-containing protein [Pseudomonadota bacterium]MBU1449899.1 ACT domain-containing protein [Pseudomonadota bacterium]MBU2467009.1 ACT domain-containing protein [Pseudomonadota bacterium]MBU2516744.1 ACT domain-containing protein [Pseudomonadota bacterium]